MSISSTAELERLLRADREVGGYQEFVVADQHGDQYEILGLECPGNGLPLVIRIEASR